MIKLKAEGIRSLQDARYCSAEGFDFLVFRFEKSYDFRMPADMIRDIAGWLSGTAIILQVDSQVADALAALPEDFRVAGIQSEAQDAFQQTLPSTLLRIQLGKPNQNTNLQYQVSASDYTPDMQALPIWLLIQSKDEIPVGIIPYGISFGIGFQDAEGELDYDRVSEALEHIRALDAPVEY
jgi:hypothetical protein